MSKRVIIITDGDEYARLAVDYTAQKIGGYCISESAGNPTTLTGKDIIKLVKKAPSEPVFIMFDDSGLQGEGPGEQALKYVAQHPEVTVLGIIAVASKTHFSEWARVDVSIDRDCNLTEYGVDKSGLPDIEVGRINGDTVYCLDELDVPIIVGIGDIGKMSRKDSVKKGCPITMKAVEIVLERSEQSGRK